jgi:hypothetical protein
MVMVVSSGGVQETGDAHEAPVAVDGGEIGADGERGIRRGLRGQRPGKAHDVVVARGRAVQREAAAGELLLGGADHGVDAVHAAAPHHRVEVAGVRREHLRDFRPARGRFAFVPGGEVGFGDPGGLVHDGLLRWVDDGASVPAAVPRGDYLPGNGRTAPASNCPFR